MKRRVDRLIFIALVIVGLVLAFDDVRAWWTGEPPVLVGSALITPAQGDTHAALNR